MTPEQIALAKKIVAQNIEAWGWGPLEEIEDLAEHKLAVEAALAAIIETTEMAAKLVDKCNAEGPYNAIGAASRLRSGEHLKGLNP